MMQNKRSPCSVDHGTLASIATKRHKADFSVSTKERKEKLGERIVALQQLVSPYGKTDTASVLMEVMEYIRFLHEQVQAGLLNEMEISKVKPYAYKMRDLRNGGDRMLSSHYCSFRTAEDIVVLSAPYLQGTSTAQMQELGHHSLESKGLCLVPISYTAGIARSNGADLWAPIKSPSPKFKNSFSQFH
ncbi:hypothetical protein SADUNF_Sadunf19G0099000 [Salix dunnii]|uniref:BHLH domain-containing protein n=1 Tax=Salix dunnii TaxID=1413687 RepID=A0A835MD04_9ROSI|nr:hypothetical protein SADUNF_Sadunf19G0099000 [Salix dunnii]